MTKQQAKQRIEKLKKLINHHRYLYHVLDRLEISGAALDSLKKELFDLEQMFPDLVTADSPTQRVGGQPLKKFAKVRHLKPMLSFNDAFSEEDMADWLSRLEKLLTVEEFSQIDFFCELKIDGLAIELNYENGIFKVGSTRGDGNIGEDVSHNLKTIEAIPLKLHEEELDLAAGPGTAGIVVVRGEAFISKKEFEEINKEQLKNGLPVYANPRNIAAGSIKQLDPKIAASRHLDFFAYDLVTDPIPLLKEKWLGTHEEKHRLLKALGFKINPHNRHCQNLKDVFAFHKYCQKLRETFPYEIDGIVVIVNNNKIFEKLGVVGKTPRGAIAYKFPLKQATTIIEDILVQVGRTGAITPVAVLKPVQVGGVTISRATLHNEDEIKRLDARIGDTAIVGRAGDVIPDIIQVLAELRQGNEKKFIMPKRCPACGTELIKPEGEVVWRCPNPDCFARQREYFYHFVSKAAFDIVGLGPKIIGQLIDGGLVFSPADLFDLKEGDLIPLERFAEKKAKNIYSAIQSKKRLNLSRFIYSLGIRNVGEETAGDLAQYFGSFEKLKEAAVEELRKVPDVGPIVAGSIYQWFKEKRNLALIEKLKNLGVEISIEKRPLSQPLKGKIFVLTGSLESVTRNEAKDKIRVLGGEISESVSDKTDFVVAGKEPGIKFKKAKTLGVKIIGEQDFLKVLRQSKK